MYYDYIYIRKTNLLLNKGKPQTPMRNNDVKDEMWIRKAMNKMNFVCRKEKCSLLQGRVSFNCQYWHLVDDEKRYYF